MYKYTRKVFIIKVLVSHVCHELFYIKITYNNNMRYDTVKIVYMRINKRNNDFFINTYIQNTIMNFCLLQNHHQYIGSSLTKTPCVSFCFYIKFCYKLFHRSKRVKIISVVIQREKSFDICSYNYFKSFSMYVYMNMCLKPLLFCCSKTIHKHTNCELIQTKCQF